MDNLHSPTDIKAVKKWDFFILHSSLDEAIARELYDNILNNGNSVFFDKESIPDGAIWDEKIMEAQNDSFITVVLISENLKTSFYGRDEMHRGIKLARTNPGDHKVIPVYLNDITPENQDFLYGIGLLQGISLKLLHTVQNLASRLCEDAARFKSGAPDLVVGQMQQHILLSFPTGPLVPFEMIPRQVINMYARLISLSEMKMVVAEANLFRQEANPGTVYIIDLIKIAFPDKIAAFDFWMQVFDYARLQGPRMLAALLMVVPDEQFPKDVKQARTNLLKALKNHS